MDDSNDQTGRQEEREGSWLRRRRGAARRAQTEREASVSAEASVAHAAVPPEPPPPPPPPKAIWTDSHCHLQDDPDPASTLALARAARVGRVICVGTDAPSSRKAVMLAGQLSGSHAPASSVGPAAGPAAIGSEPAADDEPRESAYRASAFGKSAFGAVSIPYLGADGVSRAEVWATVGLHPHDAKVGLDSLTEFLDELSAAEGFRRSRVVAIGECGLDYHYENSPRAVQREVFAAQVALAIRHRLSLVIHTREAWEDTFSILDAEGVPERTIFHCFTGGQAEAKRCMDYNAYLSFSGIVTFANADELRRAVAHCPLDSLLIETDSPFLTPVPYRGRRNNPSNVALVGNAIAKVKGFEPEVLAAVSWMNAEKAFGLGG